MWEVWSRKLPFLQYSFSYQVEEAVMKGERPKILKNTPTIYASLMKSCWEHDTMLRPPFSLILERLEWLYSHHVKTKSQATNNLQIDSGRDILCVD